MIALGLALVGIGVAIHGYIFVLESLTWTTPRTRAIFRMRTAEEAQLTKPLAFNQGFYNLFLAVIAAVGIVLVIIGQIASGAALVFAGAGSMVAAALVLVLSSPKMARAAALQGSAPLLGILALVVALAAS